MKVRIGRRLDGVPMCIDTASETLLVFVGDHAAGKTTLSRFLTRWWIADSLRTARAFAEEPHQYADLPIPVMPTANAVTADVALDVRELTIIDGADHLSAGTLRVHARGPGLTILTSYGEAARLLDGVGHPCLGLVGFPGAPVRDVRPHRGVLATGARNGYAIGQGRLDWPSDLVPVVPLPRGERDFPVHRWQPVDWAAAG